MPNQSGLASGADFLNAKGLLDFSANGKVFLADNLEVLKRLPDGVVRLMYTDPPFNTGKRQEKRAMRTVRDESGDRVGFGGNTYRTIETSRLNYHDSFDNYLDFLRPRLEEARRVLTLNGSLFLHLDTREVHYCKVMADDIFGRDCFRNEIIWAYDYGGRPKNRWPTKHDTILWYSKSPKAWVFNYEEIDRIPYMAPNLVGPKKAARGKTPTDVWWHTIVPTNGKEKTGYPSQKPLGLVERIVKVHSEKGDMTMDFFAGSGTLGEAAAREGRRFLLVDNNPEAVNIMRKRLAQYNVEFPNVCSAPDINTNQPMQ